MHFSPLHTQIWADRKFRPLSYGAKLLFIYLFTHEGVGISGIYEPDLEVASLRIGIKDIDLPMQEIINSKMIEYDAQENLIWIVNRFKLLTTHSPKVIIGAIIEINRINHPFKDKFIKKYYTKLKDFLYKVDGYELKTDDFLTKSQVLSLSKIYKNKFEIKRFLLNRGCEEQRIDQILTEALPHYKE